MNINQKEKFIRSIVGSVLYKLSDSNSRKISILPNDWKGISNKIALLSSFDDEAYRLITKKILTNKNVNLNCIYPKNPTTSELQNAVDNLTSNITNGTYCAGVVISADSYQLMKNVEQDSVTCNICWDIGTDFDCTVKSRILFVNSSLIGSKKLEEKLLTWIKSVGY